MTTKMAGICKRNVRNTGPTISMAVPLYRMETVSVDITVTNRNDKLQKKSKM